MNTLLNSSKFTNKEIFAVSQQLDKLIITYYELNFLDSLKNKT
ncbi:Spo0E family sporulation regulatory protein-aspartic acid phosphatase [Clostridium kluyveri]|nr:Spo0E family sporulation regulatory protein-aspartic acid phosphatase [Clostridium kluyveri]